MGDSLKNDKKEVESNIDNTDSEDFSTSSYTKEALKNLPEVLSFIQRLQECIFRQRNLIHKLYEKLKESASQKPPTKDASTQTCDADFEEWQSTIESGNIVEDIKKAAENAVQQTGFVYESTSGMYYDYTTGYYYNAELGLYYDGHNGIYYYFDESSKSFQFHSQVTLSSAPCDETDEIIICKHDDTRKRNQSDVENIDKIPKKIKTEIKEEGECSESSSEGENEIIEISGGKPMSPSDIHKQNVEMEDCEMKPNYSEIDPLSDEVANAWPPCLRVIVKETGLEDLLIGSLFIVTCTGGTLGREGDHSIIIPDISISKHHAKVSFNEEENCYNIVDLGSRNGTFVDGKRISVALQESDPVSLHHGTVVRVGSTHLQCHLHLGRDTCIDCEPGCILHKPECTELTDKDHETKEARHRSELRRLRKRFGLEQLATGSSIAPGYHDRAEERRKTIGSIDHNAKTETASVHESIRSSNKGFKLLSKMGWAQGQSLGKNSAKGITEPIAVEQRPDKAGLGSDAVHLPPPDPKAKKKKELWKKAQKRFQELDE